MWAFCLAERATVEQIGGERPEVVIQCFQRNRFPVRRLEKELFRKTRIVRKELYHGFAEPFHSLVVMGMYRSPSAKSRNVTRRASVNALWKS